MLNADMVKFGQIDGTTHFTKFHLLVNQRAMKCQSADLLILIYDIYSRYKGDPDPLITFALLSISQSDTQ